MKYYCHRCNQELIDDIAFNNRDARNHYPLGLTYPFSCARPPLTRLTCPCFGIFLTFSEGEMKHFCLYLKNSRGPDSVALVKNAIYASGELEKESFDIFQSNKEGHQTNLMQIPMILFKMDQGHNNIKHLWKRYKKLMVMA